MQERIQEMDGKVTIINYNVNAHSIVAAAGRMSTTEGSADEIYEKACKNEQEKNIKLIQKIMSSGHNSVLEHISLNLSFDNVSVFVEQFMIEFRLASFTVKSRRYVDFGKMGYVSPEYSQYAEENRESLRNIYEKHMEMLFHEYNAFIELGIPKEDARFILPYSFRSNFFCTVNARELIKIMNEMVYGRGKEYPELVKLGTSLFAQCEKELPYLNVQKNLDYQDAGKLFEAYAEEKPDKQSADGLVTLVSKTASPEEIICKAAALNYGVPNWADIEIKDTKQQRTIIAELLKRDRKRELEQASFTILFNKISLASVTHLVRHRMQSIIIPSYIKVCNFDKYVLPDSIVKAGLEERYRKVFSKSREAAEKLEKRGMYLQDKVYLCLSGMTIPVMTTMNANELGTFIRLRTCNRAQWEIKACADELLNILREECPALFTLYGPSCYMTGRCPEGKMTCGQMKNVCERYRVTED